MQILYTVLSGTLVYVISQYFMYYIINPSREYKKIKSKIAYSLTMYSCYYHSPIYLKNIKQQIIIDIYRDSCNEMRKIGSELSGYISTMSCLKYKKRNELIEVSRNLIGLSNGFFVLSNDDNQTLKDNREYEKNIRKILKI